MTNKLKNLWDRYGGLAFFLVVFLTVYLLFFNGKNAKNPYEFNYYRPPGYVLADLNQSATCNFSKDVNSFYTENYPETAQNIHYVVSNDDVTDPITLTDLDTPVPHVRTNTGEAPLTILYNDSVSILLTPVPPSPDGLPQRTTVSYELFKENGVLVYTDIHDGFEGPTGTMEMGYCH